jgi:hypothetical protein
MKTPRDLLFELNLTRGKFDSSYIGLYENVFYFLDPFKLEQNIGFITKPKRFAVGFVHAITQSGTNLMENLLGFGLYLEILSLPMLSRRQEAT